MKIYNKRVALIAAILGVLSVGNMFAADMNDGTFTYTPASESNYVILTGLVDANAKLDNPTIGPKVLIDGAEYYVSDVAAQAFKNKTNITGELTINLYNGGNINSEAFAGTNITSLVVYTYSKTSNIGSFSVINNNAFANCTNLKKVVLIGKADYGFLNSTPFTGCNNITELYLLGTIVNNVYPTTTTPIPNIKNATLYVTQSKCETLKGTIGWTNFKNIEPAEDLVEEITISPADYYLPTWEWDAKYPIDVTVTPSYLIPLVQGANIKPSEAPLQTRITTANYRDFFIATQSRSGEVVGVATLTLTIGDKSASINVHLGTSESTEEPEEEPVTLTIQYNSGFSLSQKMKKDQPIDVYLLPYRDYKITSIDRITDASEATTNLSFPEVGGRYTETEPIKENTTLKVNLSATNNGPATGVENVEAQKPLVVVVAGRTIMVEGVDDGEIVNVFNIAGQCVYAGRSHSVNVTESGVYIVRVDNATAKVVVF